MANWSGLLRYVRGRKGWKADQKRRSSEEEYGSTWGSNPKPCYLWLWSKTTWVGPTILTNTTIILNQTGSLVTNHGGINCQWLSILSFEIPWRWHLHLQYSSLLENNHTQRDVKNHDGLRLLLKLQAPGRHGAPASAVSKPPNVIEIHCSLPGIQEMPLLLTCRDPTCSPTVQSWSTSHDSTQQAQQCNVIDTAWLNRWPLKHDSRITAMTVLWLSLCCTWEVWQMT